MKELLFQVPDKLLLVFAALMLLRMVFPGGPLLGLTNPLFKTIRFITPLGFSDRLIALFAALWFLGIRAAMPLAFFAWNFI